MPQYIVLKSSSGTVPGDGQIGSADIYRGTHADPAAAAAAAAAVWNLPPNSNMWVDLTSNLSPFHTTSGVAAG